MQAAIASPLDYNFPPGPPVGVAPFNSMIRIIGPYGLGTWILVTVVGNKLRYKVNTERLVVSSPGCLDHLEELYGWYSNRKGTSLRYLYQLAWVHYGLDKAHPYLLPPTNIPFPTYTEESSWITNCSLSLRGVDCELNV
ncbi:hypothetical protein G9A89_000612 [Geosiphon pyriformis]|nr:hypothetical protein G9A89_000612 [Geosiphon pyriformis]